MLWSASVHCVVTLLQPSGSAIVHSATVHLCTVTLCNERWLYCDDPRWLASAIVHPATVQCAVTLLGRSVG